MSVVNGRFRQQKMRRRSVTLQRRDHAAQPRCRLKPHARRPAISALCGKRPSPKVRVQALLDNVVTGSVECGGGGRCGCDQTGIRTQMPAPLDREVMNSRRGTLAPRHLDHPAGRRRSEQKSIRQMLPANGRVGRSNVVAKIACSAGAVIANIIPCICDAPKKCSEREVWPRSDTPAGSGPADAVDPTGYQHDPVRIGFSLQNQWIRGAQFHKLDFAKGAARTVSLSGP